MSGDLVVRSIAWRLWLGNCIVLALAVTAL